MAEKKETQWLVAAAGVGAGTLLVKNLRWFDAREDAREYARAKNKRAKSLRYKVVPIKRGPRA